VAEEMPVLFNSVLLDRVRYIYCSEGNHARVRKPTDLAQLMNYW